MAFWYLDVVKKRLTKWRRAADQLDRRCGDAFTFHIEKDEANTFVLWRVCICTHQAENPIGHVGI